MTAPQCAVADCRLPAGPKGAACTAPGCEARLCWRHRNHYDVRFTRCREHRLTVGERMRIEMADVIARRA